MARYICFLCLLFVLRSQAQDSSSTQLITLKENSEQKQYKKILIAGFGQTDVRHFLDELSPKMIAYYKSQGLDCIYEFMGNDKAQFKTGLAAAVNNHQPHATLIFYHFDNEPDTLKTKSPNRIPRMLLMEGAKYQQVRKIKRRDIRIDEDLKMVILEPANNIPIWQGQLYLIDEPMRNVLYEKVSLLIVNELYKNKIPNIMIY